jgi:hypothetical protein
MQPLTALELLINLAQLLPTLFFNGVKSLQQSNNNVPLLKRRCDSGMQWSGAENAYEGSPGLTPVNNMLMHVHASALRCMLCGHNAIFVQPLTLRLPENLQSRDIASSPPGDRAGRAGV